jgi:hypothetical protein
MERKITYNGKVTKLSELDFPKELWQKLYEGFYTEPNLKKFGKKLGFGESTIKVLFEDYLEKVKDVKPVYINNSRKVETMLGTKDSPYYNDEDEIFKSLDCNYTWEELTLHEQQFYLNYNGQGKKRCFLRKRDEASDSADYKDE